jgi:lipopolysaccharide/colanic/teichoic acid biosynthesis glycosyltransferase
VARVALLAIADLGAVFVVRALIRAVRDHAVLGDVVSRLLQFPTVSGTLDGWRFPVALLLALAITGAYGARRQRLDAGRLVAAVAVAAAMLLYHEVWEQAAAAWQLAVVVAVVGPCLVLLRTLADAFPLWAAPGAAPSRVVVVASGSSAWTDSSGVGQRTGGAEAGRRIVATLGTNGRRPSQGIGHLPWVINDTQADTVLIAGPLSDRDFAFVADTALASACRLLAEPRTARVPGVEPRTVWEDGATLVELTAPTRQACYLAAKRAVDLCLSSLALVLLSPLLVVIAALVKLESPGPAIFAHWRLGVQGRLFRCYKFRSMRPDAELLLRADPQLHQLYVDNGYKLPSDQDPRLTRVGRFLRKCSLDELPQFFNVLIGDMSLVGPRPIVSEELSQYPKTASLFLSRKPGITGNWAAHGRSDIGYPDRADVELAYARQWSLLRDLELMLRTIPAVAQRRGAH